MSQFSSYRTFIALFAGLSLHLPIFSMNSPGPNNTPFVGIHPDQALLPLVAHPNQEFEALLGQLQTSLILAEQEQQISADSQTERDGNATSDSSAAASSSSASVPNQTERDDNANSGSSIAVSSSSSRTPSEGQNRGKRKRLNALDSTKRPDLNLAQLEKEFRESDREKTTNNGGSSSSVEKRSFAHPKRRPALPPRRIISIDDLQPLSSPVDEPPTPEKPAKKRLISFDIEDLASIYDQHHSPPLEGPQILNVETTIIDTEGQNFSEEQLLDYLKNYLKRWQILNHTTRENKLDYADYAPMQGHVRLILTGSEVTKRVRAFINEYFPNHTLDPEQTKEHSEMEE